MRNLSLTQRSLFTDETKDNMSLKTFKVSKNTVNAFFGVYSQITNVESLFFSTQYLFVLKFTICLGMAVTETIFGFNLNIVPIKFYLHKFTTTIHSKLLNNEKHSC